MTTASEVAFENVRKALVDFRSNSLTQEVEQLSNAINAAQVLARADPSQQQQALAAIDQLQSKIDGVSAVRALMPDDVQPKFDALQDKLNAYIAAEREETIKGPQPPTPWYAEPGFIALWVILGVIVLAAIAWAIYYAVKRSQKRKSDSASRSSRMEQQLLAANSANAERLRRRFQTAPVFYA
jgi:hypothetical protein